MNRTLLAAFVVAIATTATLVIVIHSKGPSEKLTVAKVASLDRAEIDEGYRQPEAKKEYRQFIDKWEQSSDKKVQDEVGAARIRLAYLTAKEKDYPAARKIFVEAATKYKGTGEMGADFGGIKDQALYQAAVCLSAEGKITEARLALVKFIKEHPMSPLVHAAFKRIVKIDGKTTPETERLIQSALDAQQKKIRFELSVCGPKALAYILKANGQGDIPYEEIAKDCGTTDAGTTMDGLKNGLQKRNVNYYGFQLNRDDLRKLPALSILLVRDHYYVLDRIEGELIYAFDPLRDKIQTIALPKDTDVNNQLPVLSPTILDLNAN